ncbi:E3 ubiquitin-protein ligase AMFR [Biomphalaria pfeifferi]|uniref:E3 ubiquitin-protein ligase AMFR n=1 Tax=Biomphalaria pfeifferi TaxID=112525 RepID=A0AAD8BXT2_BIOPF|nr:E3 ubiquitin-protein ligase AMFR [Biomphalaria pfeifferi]
MPALILERLPLPSLQTYISFSVVMLGLASFYAHQTVNTILNFNPDNQIQEELGLPQELVNITLPYNRDEHFLNMVYIMRVETWCIWTLVNSCYCLLILFGKLIQNVVFGELRVIEKQHLKDKFWNFIFYKFIFIFGVMNVQSMEEVVLWLAWFSGLGFLHLLTQLCKDRFEYLSFSPATPRYAHVKLLSLLLVILLTSGVVLVGCFWVGINISLTIFAFLAAESLLLILKCLYVVVRYIIQLWDMSLEGVWESRAMYVYYTELIFELVSLSVDFSHHLHMLLYGNIFLSMASLVICMQLRFLFYEFQRRVKKHKNYLKVVKEMESKFSMATQEDLEQNSDDCAICWEKMESARKLPCGHLFHNSCLRSWLEQDSSCPTCRTRLSETTERDGRNPGAPGVPNMAEGIVAPVNPATTNHFFHFDGSRYVSWLPSFSVEVTHTNLLPGQQAHATQTSQLDNMAREVQAVFPHIPQQVIMEDLRLTRSVDLTIDNILEGRITVPPLAITGSGHQRNDSHSSISGSSTTSEVSSLASDSPRVNNIPLNNLDNSLQLTEGSSERIRQSENQENSYTTTGGRFSKSATERMSMLESRKHLMLEQARRRYQEMHENQEGASSSSVDPPLIYTTSEHLRQTHPESSTLSTQEDELSRRRALLLQATQRRLERQTD